VLSVTVVIGSFLSKPYPRVQQRVAEIDEQLHEDARTAVTRNGGLDQWIVRVSRARTTNEPTPGRRTHFDDHDALSIEANRVPSAVRTGIAEIAHGVAPGEFAFTGPTGASHRHVRRQNELTISRRTISEISAIWSTATVTGKDEWTNHWCSRRTVDRE